MLNRVIPTDSIIIYTNGEIELTVSVDEETVWLKAEDIGKLFNVQRPAIVKHIGNIYKTDKLSENSTYSILEQVAKDYNEAVNCLGYQNNKVLQLVS